MPVGLELVGSDLSGRPWFLFDGDDLAGWDVAASAGFEQFTAFLALNADRYADQEINAAAFTSSSMSFDAPSGQLT